MSMNNLTIDGEFRYIVQWFNEWSELQRDDFVPILVKYITGSHTSEEEDDDNDGLAAAAVSTPVNMNGLPNDLEFSGRPMSLFQCRIKLFNQWNRRWPTEFKEKLQQKIGEIDGKVGEKIKFALNPNNIGSLTNGYASNEEDPQQSLEQSKENGENLVIVANHAAEIEAMALNDPMTEVLNNETSVDDIETNEDVSNSIEQPLFNNNMVTTNTPSTSSAPLHTGINNDDNNDVAATGNVKNDNGDGGNGDDDEVCSNNTRHNHAINERGEPVEQVVQMQNLQINEEKAEAEKDHEDVTTATVEQKQQQQQQPLPSITVTVNPVVVTQTITTNAEVPLVV